MVEIKNCWEFRNCGREPGGLNVAELGICPAATNKCYHGVNRGKAGGRFCWHINGTLCKETSDNKQAPCADCGFFQEVEQQEGRFFILEPHNLSHRTGLPGQEFVVLETKHTPVPQPQRSAETNSPPSM
jgi:hypothetical protein